MTHRRSSWQEGKALRDFAARNPDDDEAARLARRSTPFVGWLPQPSDAIINVLRSVIEKAEQLRSGTREEPCKLNCTVDAIEAPSTRLAVDYEMRSRGLHAIMAVNVANVQTPDPRAAEGDPALALWRYHGTEPFIVRAAPPPRVAQAIAEVAARDRFDSTEWFDAAREVVRRVRPTLEDLLGVMVHPLPPPANKPAFVFLWHLQVAAACAIGSLDEGWGQRGLEALLLGPVDWTSAAASIALAEVAERHAGLVPAIDALFRRAIQKMPKDDYWCFRYPLVVSWLRLPELGEEFVENLEDEWRSFER
jgi:hypothetical protein